MLGLRACGHDFSIQIRGGLGNASLETHKPVVMLKTRFLLFAWLAVGVAVLCSCEKQSSAPPPPVTAAGTKAVPVAVTDTNVPSMEAAQSVVVTHDLDLGPNPPGLAELLQQIERRHQPADGAGRTFAILEAFTQSGAPPGKFRLNLRLSTEKPGTGEILFRRKGEPLPQSLWKNLITPAAKPPSFSGGQLTILFDVGDGKQFTVDGSMNPASILEANLKEPGVPVAQAWPDGEERKLKFIYSACGCPIEVKCRRAGDRTVRTEAATQVIFPDDPAAAQLISRLMRW